MWSHCRVYLTAVVGSTTKLTTKSVRLQGLTSFGHRTSAIPPSPCLLTTSFIHIRNFHSKKLSRNLEFFSAGDKLQVDQQLKDEDRPLTLLFCWLMSKDKHVQKYAKFYNNLGVDVLKVRISPYDLLRPTKGTQCVADQVLDFLHSTPSTYPLMVHGFSVGAYVFSEVMIKMEEELEKHNQILKRFVGQIWDSPVDLAGVPYGTSRAITSNVMLQKSMQKYLEWYLRVRYNTATIHYERARIKFHENFIGVPGLFFLSNSDPVSTPEMVSAVYDNWEALGYHIYTKCWERSRHVSHYRMHPKEYEDLVLAFIEKIGIVEGNSKQKVVASSSTL